MCLKSQNCQILHWKRDFELILPHSIEFLTWRAVQADVSKTVVCKGSLFQLDGS